MAVAKMNVLILSEGSLTMAVTAPIPPTKPIPPSAPVMTPTGSGTSPESHSAPAPASLHQEKTEPVKKANQQQENKSSPAAEKSSSSTAPESPRAVPVPTGLSYDSQDTVSAGTVAPSAQYPAVHKNTPFQLGALSFLLLLIVLIVAAVGIRLWKHKSKPARTLIDCSEKTVVTHDEDGIHIAASSQPKPSKVKKHFEIRI